MYADMGKRITTTIKCRELIFVLFIIAMTVWGYYDTLDDFFIMDDIDVINNFSSFQGLLKHLQHGMGGEFYRPLINLVFIWDFYWSGWNPLGYHLSNLFFHILNALLVFWITTRLTKSSFTGMAAGLLFGLHTCHTEAVTWISGRMDVVCTTFFLLSIVTFSFSIEEDSSSLTAKSQEQKIAYILSLAFFICALLTKEMAVTLPAVVIVYDLIFAAHIHRFAVWRRIRIYAPYWLILGGYFVFRFFLFSGLGGYKTKLFGTFIFSNFVTYFKFFTVPFVEYIFSSSLAVNLGGLAIITLICLIISKISRFAILWIFITLLPVSAFTLGRGAYLASAGFCILFATLLTFSIPGSLQLFQRKKGLRVSLRLIQGVIIAVLFYQYSIALKTSNAWWSGVADVNERIPLMVKTIHPTFSRGARICLQNVPLVFNQRFNGAFLLRYPQSDIGGVYVRDFEKCVKGLANNELETTYFFHYDQKADILHDVTYQQREKHTGHVPVKDEKLSKQLSSKTPQLQMTFTETMPMTSLELVTSLANGIDASQGQLIAHGRINGNNGIVEFFDIVAGQDTAEWAIRFPGISEQVQHEIPVIYEAWTVQHAEKSFTVAQNYIKKIHLKRSFIPKSFSLELVNSPEGQSLILDLNRILLYTEGNEP